jgi:hypothetical protein
MILSIALSQKQSKLKKKISFFLLEQIAHGCLGLQPWIECKISNFLSII